MFFIVLVIVAFLAQCAFQLNDEHLLILLIVSLVLLTMSIVYNGIDEVLFERRFEILKQLAKQRAFKVVLLNELHKQVGQLEGTIMNLAEMSFLLVEYVPEAFAELYNLTLELEFQKNVLKQLEQISLAHEFLVASDQKEVISTLNKEVFDNL